MTKKTINHGLGRGLDALLGVPAEEETQSAAAPAAEPAGDRVEKIDITKIDPNRDQPRRDFDEAALNELSASIRSIGVVQPIIVQKKGSRYTIIAGERRWRAARMAELTEIPAIVRDWDEDKRMEATLVENLQRDDLNPVEEAMGVKALMTRCKLTQEEVSQRIGKSRPAVANLLRLLNLPAEVLDMLRTGKLSAGHARALVAVDADRQLKLARLAAEQGWSVRQLERICAQPVKDPAPVTPVRTVSGEIKTMEKMAREVFGTRVTIDGDEEKGRMIIKYATADDLQRIWDVLETITQSQQ